MAQIPYYDARGSRSGELEVDEKLFGEHLHLKLLHQVVVSYEANRRQGNANTKDKGDVEGSSRKPWPQKHTGNARAGMIRSPIWRKGGISHGPHTRDHRRRITRSMRETALNGALLGKIRDAELHVIESLDFKAPRTKEMRKILDAIGLKGTVLIAVEAHDRSRWLSARNLDRVRMAELRILNAYEVLRHKNLLLTRAAFEKLVSDRKGEGK
jgi:large subunit ribosomal protein L4